MIKEVLQWKSAIMVAYIGVLYRIKCTRINRTHSSVPHKLFRILALVYRTEMTISIVRFPFVPHQDYRTEYSFLGYPPDPKSFLPSPSRRSSFQD